MRKSIAAAASLLAAGAAVAPATANAEEGGPAGPEVAFVNANVVVSGAHRDEATVLAKYRCDGGREGTHLWVSVKQGENLEAEGSSQWATAHYDTNYMWAQDPVGMTMDCDGQWHADRVTVKMTPASAGLLQRGSAWVQFCAFDNHGGFTSVNGYKAVRVG